MDFGHRRSGCPEGHWAAPAPASGQHGRTVRLPRRRRDVSVETAARRLPCPTAWHPGYRLRIAESRLHADDRGREYGEPGARIAEGGRLDPGGIGDAARTGRHDLQDLEKVWHRPPPDTGGGGRRARR